MPMIILPKVLLLCIGLLAVSLLCTIYRLVQGPSIVDRLLALDTLFLNTICFILLLGAYWATTMLFEVALLMTMLGFVSTAALARYFTTGHVVD